MRSLLALVDELEARWPDVELYWLHDWHEHDGVMEPPRGISWSEVRAVLHSDESLSAARAGDTYVRVGICPKNWQFYLRFYPEDDEEETDPPRLEHVGNFDLTCSPSFAETVLERLAPLHLTGLRCEPAKEYFDCTWAGEWLTRRRSST
jgi:hypothetical protein